MLEWMDAHAPALQVVLSTLTAIVWIAYFQLLLTSLRHQRRPVLLINTGAGTGIRQSCFISNLGMEPIFLMDLAIRVEAGDRIEIAAITDREPAQEDGASDATNATNQGPLDSGAMRNLGTFEDLIRRAIDTIGAPRMDEVTRLELVAVYTVAAREKICAAKRSFTVEEGDPPRLVPDSIRARQIVGWWRRRRLARWLEGRRQGRDNEGGLP